MIVKLVTDVADNQKKTADLTARLEQSECIERTDPISSTRRDNRVAQRGEDLSRDQEVLDLSMAGEVRMRHRAGHVNFQDAYTCNYFTNICRAPDNIELASRGGETPAGTPTKQRRLPWLVLTAKAET